MVVVICGYEKYLPTWEKNHTNAIQQHQKGVNDGGDDEE